MNSKGKMNERAVVVTKDMLFAPSLEEQAAKLGGTCEYLWRPTERNPRLLVYSTSLARDGDHRILAQRYLQNRNGSLSVNWRENPSTTVISTSNRLNAGWKTLGEVNLLECDTPLSVEDSRIIEYTSVSKLLLATVWPFTQESKRGPNRAVTSQALISLDNELRVNSLYFPRRGHNGEDGLYEKNWMPIPSTSDFTYSLDGEHIVYNFRTSATYRTHGISWSFGEIHGGSQWVLCGSLLVAAFHSSLPIRKDNINGIPHAGRYYFVGMAFAHPTPPYRIVGFTPEPLLLSSALNPRVDNGTICLFVSGLVTDGDWLEMGVGVNDGASAIVQIPFESVRERIRVL